MARAADAVPVPVWATAPAGAPGEGLVPGPAQAAETDMVQDRARERDRATEAPLVPAAALVDSRGSRSSAELEAVPQGAAAVAALPPESCDLAMT